MTTVTVDQQDGDSDDNRLKVLETQGVKTEGRLTHVEQTLSIHGSKLDQIITAVSAFSHRPVFDVHKMISSVRDVVVVGGAFCTLAVWFVLTLTAAQQTATTLEMKQIREIHEMELKHMKEKLEWFRTQRPSATMEKAS